MVDLIRQFNKMSDARQSLIKKALTSATNVGEALTPQNLEKIITNTVVALSPEVAVLSPLFDKMKRHDFNRISALPAAGGAMGEAAVTPTRNGTFARDYVNLKVIRRKGAVTNFLQDSSAAYIDAAAAEMENHLLAHAYDLAYYTVFGNEDANSYEFDGLDKLIATNRTNEAVGGTVPTSLKFLDDMIDENIIRQGANHRKAFLMSAKMQSHISRLLTNVRVNQGLAGDGMNQIEINGGWRLMAYRDIPILPSRGMRPTGTMTTITPSAAGTGSLSDGAYYFRVAPITYNGEQLASAEATITLSGGGSTQAITLTFAAYPGALAYKIYASQTTGTEVLVKMIPAYAYDGSGTIGSAVTTDVFKTLTPSDDVPTHMQSDKPLVATGGVAPEIVILWDLDEYQGLGKFPYTNSGASRMNGLVTVEPLARTDDDLPFLIKTYGALCPAFEATSAMHRGLRIA